MPLFAPSTVFPAPLASDVVVNGGIFVPRRSLDRFAVTPQSGVKHVVVMGDSVLEGTYMGPNGPAAVVGGYFDNMITRLARNLGNAMGPLVGAGFFGLYRSGAPLGFANSGAEWAAAGVWAFVTNPGALQLVPYGAALQSAGASTDVLTFTPPATIAPRQVTDCVTNGTTGITSATAAFANTDIGAGAYGLNIPRYGSIVNVVDASHATLDRPALGAGTGVLGLQGRNVVPGGIARIDIIWIDTSTSGTFSWSKDGGATWNNVVSTHPANPTLKRTTVTAANPATFKIRAASAGGGAGATIQCGIELWNTLAPTGGVMVHNLARDGATLDPNGGVPNTYGFLQTASGGDSLRYLDNNGDSTNTGSLQPSLVICMYSNDALNNNTALWTTDLTTLYNRLNGYCDLLLMNVFEQSRAPGVSAATQAAYRAALKAFCVANNVAYVDMYDAWAAQGDVGYAGANADGLMIDGLHPTLEGHADMAGHLMRMFATLAV